MLFTCAFAALGLTGCGKSDQNNTASTTPDTAPPPLAALPLATGSAPAAAPALADRVAAARHADPLCHAHRR